MTFIPNYVSLFHQLHNTAQFETWCQYHYFAVVRMRHAGYQRFAVLLGDFSDPNFLDCLSQVLSFYATLSFIIVHRFSTGLRSGLFPGYSSTDILFFFRNSVATFDWWQEALSCTKIVRQWTCMYNFSFMVVLGGMEYRRAAPRMIGHSNHFAWRLFHCGYKIFLVKTLTVKRRNVHVARYKLLHGAFVRKQHFLPLSDDVWQNPVCFSSSLVPPCGTSWLRRLKTVLEPTAVPFKRKIARVFL